MLKIDKKHYKGIDIYYIGYITSKIIDECETISRVNPLHLRINHVSGYIKEKKWKYLIYDSVDENKKVLKNTQLHGMELKAK